MHGGSKKTRAVEPLTDPSCFPAAAGSRERPIPDAKHEELTMWANAFGKNLTSSEVCEFLARSCGCYYTVVELEKTFKRGSIYQNGGIWFQRID